MSQYSSPLPEAGRIRIGVGAGFAGDRLEPAILLAEYGHLDALVFECLAERTIAAAQERKSSGLGPGYDEGLVHRVLSVAALLPAQTRIITNAGAADPVGAAHAVREALDATGLGHLRVAAVAGDDVLANIDLEACEALASIGDRDAIREQVISANAYIGAGPIVDALRGGANIVITGRCADAALFLAPLVHRFNWSMDDLDRLARGTLVGHLLECAGQLTGGYFADGVRKTVPDLWSLGFPFADVDADGNATYSKLSGTGGRLDRQTVLEQLLYEIDDPARYLTPDVSVDLRHVQIRECGPDRIEVSGATAVGRPERLKVSIGVREGFLAKGEVAYSGPQARERADMAMDVIRKRWTLLHGFDDAQLECSLVGVNATRPWLGAASAAEPRELLARFTLRSPTREQACTFVREVESLYTNGPYGGGGATASFRETIGITSTMIDRDLVTPVVTYL